MEEMDLEIGGKECEAPSKDCIDNSQENENQMIEGESECDKNDEPDVKSDESSVDDDDDEEDTNEAEVERLESLLVENPYDYASHLALIQKLQKMGELERLRASRENMSSKYPLSPDIWLSWLRDEFKLATTVLQRRVAMELGERAIKDYMSVEVWLEYLQFSIGTMSCDPNFTEYSMRCKFEDALCCTGLHVTKGAVIWEAFREFELVLFGLIDPNDEEKKKNQLEKIASLFQRQLGCPLLDMEKTLEEYKNWRKGEYSSNLTIDDSIVMSNYERAYNELLERLPYEEKLVSAKGDGELYDAYAEYLRYEKEKENPEAERIIVLYERAITDLSLETRLWLDYLLYLNKNGVKGENDIEAIYTRASRNIPWCGKLWKDWMRLMEKWKRPAIDVQTLLEKALSAGFSTADEYRDLWIAYIEYRRRLIDHEKSAHDEQNLFQALRNTFNRACEHLAKLFGLQGDPNCVILQYWARLEANYAHDMEKARSLWSDILSQGHSTTAVSWLEYISLEKCYGDTKHLRKLYRKAIEMVQDWPESIVTSWLDFERDEGTLDQIEFCEQKSAKIMEKILEQRQKSQQQTSSEIFGKKIANKRKSEQGRWRNLGPSPHKQPKIDKPFQPKLRESILNVEMKKSSSSAQEASTSKPPAVKKPKIPPPPGFVPPEEEKMDSTPEVDDKVTVFVSNLDYTATEAEVKEALQLAGPIMLVRLVQDYKGRSKGFGYVQFENANTVEQALKLDRIPIKGRPMFVSRCDPDKTSRGSGFKYRCTLEKNKLFIKGLPVSTTKEELVTLFSAYGSLQDVRLVTYRNGHSKGLAYVEFEDAACAGKALLATDGMTIADKTISVAISQPPERKRGGGGGDGEETPAVKSLGGAIGRTHLGGQKTLLSMIPRNVKVSGANNAPIAPGNGVKQPMNNQDFRKMLLNEK